VLGRAEGAVAAADGGGKPEQDAEHEQDGLQGVGPQGLPRRGAGGKLSDKTQEFVEQCQSNLAADLTSPENKEWAIYRGTGAHCSPRLLLQAEASPPMGLRQTPGGPSPAPTSLPPLSPPSPPLPGATTGGAPKPPLGACHCCSYCWGLWCWWWCVVVWRWGGVQGYACEATEAELKQYMSYELRGLCPDDWFFVQHLIFVKNCYALPKRRCLARTPQGFIEVSGQRGVQALGEAGSGRLAPPFSLAPLSLLAPLSPLAFLIQSTPAHRTSCQGQLVSNGVVPM